MKRVMQLPLLVAWISLLALFHVSYISASSIGGPPPGGRDTGGRNSGSGQDAVGTKQPARNPARTIVVPTIVVNEALLKRLSSQPVELPPIFPRHNEAVSKSSRDTSMRETWGPPGPNGAIFSVPTCQGTLRGATSWP